MWNLIGLGLMLFLSAARILHGQESEPEVAELSILITGADGGALPAGTLTITSQTGDTAYHGPIDKTRRLQVPYGRYTVTFRSDLLTPVTRTVMVNTHKALVVLTTEIDPENMHMKETLLSVSIHVQSGGSCSTLMWAKLSGVFSTYSSEQVVNSSGYALFDAVPIGSYVVVVVDGHSVRGLAPVLTHGPVTRVEIDLKPCGP